MFTETDPPYPQREPIFNGLPAVVLALTVLILAVHLVSVFAGGMAHNFIYSLAALRTGALAEAAPAAPLSGLPPYLLHVFVHFGWMHLVMNLGILLAFGAAARWPFGPGLRGDMGFVIFFFTCAVGGAGLHALTHMSENSIMVGASTAISGLLAAAGWARGGYAMMLRLAVPWLGINIVIAVLDSVLPLPIAWAGHVGGLLAGMLVYPVFVWILGGWPRRI